MCYIQTCVFRNDNGWHESVVLRMLGLLVDERLEGGMPNWLSLDLWMATVSVVCLFVGACCGSGWVVSTQED